MEDVILIKYEREDLDNLVEDVEYLVLFERCKATIMFPNSHYVKKENGEVVEMYAEALSLLDKQEIPMRYRSSTRSGELLFELNIKQIYRGKKIDELLNG